MRIGLICRAEGVAAGLPKNWRPPTLGARLDVVKRLQDLTGSRFDRRKITVETAGGVLELSIGDADQVESVSVNCLPAADAMSFLRQICESLGARYCDSEEGDFIEL